jgi:hypothetical protein
MADPPPSIPSFSNAQVLAALKSAAAIGLTQTRNGETDLMKFGYDILGVAELLCDCTESEIDKHEISDRYPEYQDYIVVLDIDLEGEQVPFYVKVALSLPDLEAGELMSFHPRGYTR